MLFVLAATAALGFGWLGAEPDAVSEARADATFGARKAAEQIGRNLAAVRATVDLVASSPGAAEAFRDPGECRLSFSLGGADDGHLDELRTDGTLVCSSRPPMEDEAVAYRRASWLPVVSRTPRLIGPVPDDRSGRQSVLVAAPVAGFGTVVAFVDLAALGAAAGDTFGGARGLEFVLVSSDGRTILSRWPAAARWAGVAVRDSRFAADGRTGDGTDVTGLRRLYGSGIVPGSGWRLYAGAIVRRRWPAHIGWRCGRARSPPSGWPPGCWPRCSCTGGSPGRSAGSAPRCGTPRPAVCCGPR